MKNSLVLEWTVKQGMLVTGRSTPYEFIRQIQLYQTLTARKFTREEQAQNHVHVGNFGLSLRVMRDWLDSMHAAM